MLNSCILMGRFTHNPELKTITSSNNTVKFSLAVTRFKATTNFENKTDFIDCMAWNNTAEFICKYFKKGDPIIVEGRPETKQYEDKQGNKRKTYEVIVNNVNFCAFKKDEVQSTDTFEDLDNDLPF